MYVCMWHIAPGRGHHRTSSPDVYVCMYVCVYIQVCMYVCVCVHVYTYISVCVCMCGYIYKHIYCP